MSSFKVSGQLIDLHKRDIYPATVSVEGGRIVSIEPLDEELPGFILPGFVDAHVHIESSMLVPAAFASMAVVHGTVATVSDPHEIANVCGVEGVRYMIDNARQTPFKCFFGAPSCVPATAFETAGATIGPDEIRELLQSPDIWYLAEMMNYPGVLHRDPDVMAKIAAAKEAGKPVDGHAPGLRGADVQQYVSAGISTDHECFTLPEAMDKLAAGMHILIREGSAARNFDALHYLLSTHPDQVMFCSDDKHPDDLELGHINRLVQRAQDKGHDLIDILRAACVNPVLHYKLPVGLLRVGDPADFIVVDNLQDFGILETYIDGRLVAEKGQSKLPQLHARPLNRFEALPKKPEAFAVKAEGTQIRVIEALEGQLITRELVVPACVEDGQWVSNVAEDILKIAVVNRYVPDAPPAVAFIRNFGLKQGAIASTVAHDCHNMIVVGVDDLSVCKAVNALIEARGGIAVVDAAQQVHLMPLPVAGLMTDKNGYEVAHEYAALDAAAKSLGCRLKAPFMTLSFMALLVIPALKLSDKGLFDGSAFRFVPLASA